MASASAVRSFEPSGIALSTGVRKASIMAAVAVLLTNAEKMAVTTMKPRSTVSDLVPNGLRRIRAETTSSRVLVMPMARMNPPMKSRMVGSAKQCMMSLYGT